MAPVPQSVAERRRRRLVAVARVRGVGRLEAAVRGVSRLDATLGAVFVLAAVFYVWTAATSVPLSLHDGSQDRYNLLASALLHLRLSVGQAPSALTHLSNPYNPELNRQLLGGPTDATSLNDDVLYHGQLYFIWGPAPALVLLVPLHVLGLEPSASVTVAVYSIAGLGFALGTLRVLIKQLSGVPIWTCALAGLALSLGSAIPFILRTPSVSEDVLAGGYCFTMAGIWLAMGALAGRSASVTRLVAMSLCFGLAAGSRPGLGLCALVLIPVYLRLRSVRARRSLASALGLPIAVCAVLLLAYNQARFDQPLEIGARYQLSGNDARDAPLGRPSYAVPGSWPYVANPPGTTIVFPFIVLSRPKLSSPTGLAAPEVTGGLLPMTPIVAFVAVLPWLWRRRRGALGALLVPLLALSGIGLAMMLLAAYEYFAPTERYEVDFATLFVLGGLAGWLALCAGPPSPRRSLLRIGGGALVAWGCIAGFAASFLGYGNYLATNHPQTWRALEDAGAPLSTAIDNVIGHPVLAASFASIDVGVRHTLLAPGEPDAVTIVSPSARTATLSAVVERLRGTRYRLEIEVPGSASASYAMPAVGKTLELPVRLRAGLNHVVLFPVGLSPAESEVVRPVMSIAGLSVGPRTSA
jgi:hypothetical protein